MKRFAVVAAGVVALLALAPLPGGATPPLQFTVSPATLNMTTTAGSITYSNVTVTTRAPVVIRNPAPVDPASFGDGSSFGDTQAGSCWQSYESHGIPIPPHTSCTIQVGFHPTNTGTYNATLSVTRCTSWHLDPTYGFIVCDTLDGSRTVALNGTGT